MRVWKIWWKDDSGVAQTRWRSSKRHAIARMNREISEGNGEFHCVIECEVPTSRFKLIDWLNANCRSENAEELIDV